MLDIDGECDRDWQPDFPAARDSWGGRACIAGTGVSVCRIAQWHNMGYSPEEIANNFGHLSLAQVHAALTYYYANKAEIEADLETEERLTEELERQHRR
jgi:uncharacterized protein (DUF433 family)